MKKAAEPGLCRIQASAGSGKTWELTRRFLERLAACGPDGGRASASCALAPETGHSWRDIIAVTFTNAAAAEMRERVLRRLKEAALGAGDEGVPFAPEEARRWVDAILRDMSALNIRTIDSLLHLIVRSSALDLGLAPDFEPVFATEEALTPYYDLVLDRASRDDPAMRGLLRSACRSLANSEDSKGFLVGEKLRQQLRLVIDDVLRGRLDGVAAEDEIKEKLELSESSVRSLARQLLAAAEEIGIEWKKEPLRIISAIADGDLSKCELKTPVAPEPEKFFKGKIPAAMIAPHAQFTQAALGCREARAVLLPALRRAPFVRLAQTLVTAFYLNREQEGGIPGILIPRWAAESLSGDHGVSDALCRLGSRLTHFLVDEFQDTSREQWETLRPLVADALARGGSLTWVGDIKQSIYSWRGGDPTLFNAVLEDTELRRLTASGTESLPYNRRSREQIVAHNNSVFAPLGEAGCAHDILELLLPRLATAQLDAGARRLAEAFAGAEQQCPAGAGGGFVHVERIEADHSEELNEAVLSRLCELLKDDILPRRPLSDILVLVRSNEKGRLVAEALAREGIPVITENSLLLAEHPLITQLVAFLDFLDTPEDDIAFWTALTGSLVLGHPLAGGLTGEELHDWCAQKGPGPLFQRFRRRWPRIWEQLFAPFHAQSALLTPYDATREWMLRLDAEARFPGERTFLRRFLEVLQNAEEKGLASLGAFLEHWRSRGGEEKAPMPGGMDAVRVMTIHKAKGLAAPCVMVPWTSFAGRPSEYTDVIEYEGLKLAVPGGTTSGARHEEYLAAQACESLNLLYVAFTRARDELHVFRTSTPGLERISRLGSALDALWARAGLEPPFDLGEPGFSMVEEREAVGAEPLSGACEAPLFPPAPPVSEADEAGENWRPMQWLPRLKIFRNPLFPEVFRAEDRGTLLHLCLERLTCSGEPRQAAEAAVTAALAASEAPVPRDAAFRAGLVDALAWFAAEPRAAGWLAHGRPEQPLMTTDGRLLRVDLLVREAWGTLVIDYKSGQPAPEHARQVRSYVENLAAEPGSGVTLGLLVYLDLQRFQLVTAETLSDLVPECGSLLPPGGAGAPPTSPEGRP
ncbi:MULTISPECIES: UvrD-helicase domain-containing protein [unclassified Desulfovibrio]|uniref:UvrD-helicase domain-containing protein n=1 Tax=unclassified Desulfovibrio TaxID=2593640 RepID=UPI0013E9BEF9|nr:MULTISPECIES: UvrD-helicase domain-containing protein [unclassified Desulfovibrio]